MSPRWPSVEDRMASFDGLIDRTGGPDACWPWVGSTRGGYGRWWSAADRRYLISHREAARRDGLPVADGVFVCHRCDNPSCCNPAHLFVGTHDENMRDMVAKGRQRHGESHPRYRHGRYVNKRRGLPRELSPCCRNGHPFDEANTVHRPDGSRRCRSCQRAADLRYRRQRRAAEA